ncbi:MAG: BamA/TamA family outer membrane protein [Bacillota bacterium]|nr:BamA/TamA family outer membrane protein [Bacillota bacterium]
MNYLQQRMRTVAAPSVLLLAVAGLFLLGWGVPPARGANPIATEIAVEGNHYVPADVILEAVKETKVGQPVSEEALKKDLQAIHDLGYFFDVRARLSEQPGGAKVVFAVVENPIVKGIEITGGSLFPVEQLKGELGIAVGEILNLNKLQEGLKRFLDKGFQEYGIPARIKDVAITDAGIVKIVLAETRVGKIEITGNQKTKDYVIRREIRTRPGEVLDLKKLQADLRRVANLGFFDEVSRKFSETSDPDVTDLTIEVKERKTGTAAAGAGWSSSDGLVGYLEVADENFLGRGQRVNVRWEFGKNKNTWELGFFEPYLDDRGTFGGFNLYNRRLLNRVDEYGNTYNQYEAGGDVTLGRRLDDFTRVSGRLTVEDTRYEGYVNPDFQYGKTRSLTFSVVNDTRDFILRPTSGGRRSVSAEFAPQFLGSDWIFNKYEVDLSQYYKAGWAGQTVALHLDAGLITGESVPPHELFSVGGSDTLRGYPLNYFVGDKKLVLNAEYRFWIVQNLQGAVFFDLGKAWKRDEPLRLDEMVSNFGLGVRVDTPVGVIRIDHGFGAPGRQAQTYFSFGQAF